MIPLENLKVIVQIFLRPYNTISKAVSQCMELNK